MNGDDALGRAIEDAVRDPAALEAVYRGAVRDGLSSAFARAIETRYARAPEEPLVAAWHFRLRADDVAVPPPSPTVPAPERRPDGGRWTAWPAFQFRNRPWGAALRLALIGGATALVFGLVTEHGKVPLLPMAWGPLAALLSLLLLSTSEPRDPAPPPAPTAGPLDSSRRTVAALAALALLAVFAETRGASLDSSDPSFTLLLLHTPGLSWILLGAAVLLGRSSDRGQAVAVLKSMEATLATGILAGVAGIFVLISVRLFSVLGLEPPEWLMRGAAYAAPGVLPILAIASVYDARLTPEEQPLQEGFTQLVQTVARLFVPLTLVVLLAYIVSIPFRFAEPFLKRDVLIVYNLMLFAVIALVVCATPVAADAMAKGPSRWLRGALAGVAGLAVAINLYAMAAILYRTAQGGLTANRLTVIGWNAVNIIVLALLFVRLLRPGARDWVQASQATFRVGLSLYGAWTAVVVFLVTLIVRTR
jgi:hypothetical protein